MRLLEFYKKCKNILEYKNQKKFRKNGFNYNLIDRIIVSNRKKKKKS